VKKSFTLQPRDLCRLKKLAWGAKFALSTENFRVKSLLFLVFCRPQKKVQFVYLGPTADIREKMEGAESVKTISAVEFTLMVLHGAVQAECMFFG
jgi:hypothetical protein